MTVWQWQSTLNTRTLKLKRLNGIQSSLILLFTPVLFWRQHVLCKNQIYTKALKWKAAIVWTNAQVRQIYLEDKTKTNSNQSVYKHIGHHVLWTSVQVSFGLSALAVVHVQTPPLSDVSMASSALSECAAQHTCQTSLDADAAVVNLSVVP